MTRSKHPIKLAHFNIVKTSLNLTNDFILKQSYLKIKPCSKKCAQKIVSQNCNFWGFLYNFLKNFKNLTVFSDFNGF